MQKIIKSVIALSAVTSLSLSAFAAEADILGDTIQEPLSAVYESQATLVAASRYMNTAEEVKVVAPASEADATVIIAGFDDKADLAKDKSVAAYDKAAEYLTLAQDETNATAKAKYVAAADTYEKTAYFYSVAADLYLTAQQKEATLAAKVPDAKTSEDVAGNLKVKSLADAKLALTEAKAAVATQKNASELISDAVNASTAIGTSANLSATAEVLDALSTSVAETKATITGLISDYEAKAAAVPAGPIRDAYKAVVAQYKSASAISTTATQNGETATAKFTNAVPENPANPGEELKWHIFQADPDTALAVMKYNYAQLSFSAIRWQGVTQSVAQDPDSYLIPANHQESIPAYINGFRTSSIQVSSEAKDLLALVSRYNDQVAAANDVDAAKWTEVSSYLVDIVTVYGEMAQSQYQIYTLLSAANGAASAKALLVEQSAEVKTVLKAGEKVVATAGEVDAKVVSGKTEIDVYTTTPEEKVTVTLTKAGAKTVTATDVSNLSGIAEINLAKDYVGYTVSVSVEGKVVDKETVTKP